MMTAEQATEQLLAAAEAKIDLLEEAVADLNETVQEQTEHIASLYRMLGAQALEIIELRMQQEDEANG